VLRYIGLLWGDENHILVDYGILFITSSSTMFVKYLRFYQIITN